MRVGRARHPAAFGIIAGRPNAVTLNMIRHHPFGMAVIKTSPSLRTQDTSSLLRSLAEAADGPPTRTLLVASTRGEGRELLRALARARGRWAGLVVTTPRPLALEIVGAQLSGERLDLLDAFDEQALLDELLDEALEAGIAPRLRELAEGVGFRKAARDVVTALRLAGVSSKRLTEAPFTDPARRELIARLLTRYQQRLRKDGLADTALLLERATTALRDGIALPADRILLLPGLGVRGVAGRFLGALEARGARRLATDPVRGIPIPSGFLWQEAGTLSPLGDLEAAERAAVSPPPPSRDGTLDLFDVPAASRPDLRLFHAAGVTEELREVLRRVIAAGLRWDDAEIVTPDPGVYGPALHGLSIRLGIPVTFAVGLPVERTRPGRAVAAYLRWLEEGFPDALLRRLLETGDLAPPRGFRETDGTALARRLRGLRIGWGRERYLPAVQAALARLEESPLPAREEETEEERARRQERTRRETTALGALLESILSAAPKLSGRMVQQDARVSPSELAKGLRAFLGHVPSGGSVDDTALERLQALLVRIERTLTRSTSFRAAVSVVSGYLAIRVPAPRAEGQAPWSSAGGHLHLADVEHGGMTGRRATFVVGLDAGRFPGTGLQDPFLLDSERRALAPGDLPTSRERIEERRFRMAALLARLRGRVTLSYPAWEAAEGRVLSPSPLMLQAFRLLENDPRAGYDELLERLGVPVSLIPIGTARLDRQDVWLGALSSKGRLLEGEATVQEAYPGLAAGVRAKAAREEEAATAHHGLVAPHPNLDPRVTGEILSASRLEVLGRCPLRYFYRHVLRVKSPDDPFFDPGSWLDALRRGGLLHRVYERTLREARAQELDYADAAFEDLATRALGIEAAVARSDLPPPSEAVFAREMQDLREDVHSFVGMIRETRPDWIELEMKFGLEDGGRPVVTLHLPGGGTIQLRGAIDRVDRERSGLLVVDYKTGSVYDYQPATGMHHGGRRLQNSLYLQAAEALLGERVEAMAFHFPTRRGENQTHSFARSQLEQSPAVVEAILAVAASGRFLPTDNPQDCRYCEFAAVCRVTEDPWGLTSPPASWAKEGFDRADFDLFRAVRTGRMVRAL
jgi:hypothetical protein